MIDYPSMGHKVNLCNFFLHKLFYTPDLPKEILKRIVYERHLTQFYNSMEKHILNNDPYIISYLKDKFFRHTIKKTKSEEYLPFWWHMRRVKMSDRTLRRISASADVSEELLRDIQKSNMTLVRTDDPIKRKSLTMILSSHNIVFK